MTYDINPADDNATGDTDTTMADIEECVSLFNRSHTHHHVDYTLHSGGDFTLFLCGLRGTVVDVAYNTLDIDSFWDESREDVAA